jgi:hypothetical protein
MPGTKSTSRGTPLYNGAAGVTAPKLPLINPTTGHYEMRIADGSDTPGGTLQE